MSLSDIIIRTKLLFLRDKEFYYALRDIIGFFPRNIKIYRVALTHKSIKRRSARSNVLDNERLEFLGDAVLGAVVGDIVFHHFPTKHEGFLTTTRSKLVQREMLNRLATDMGITQLIRIDNQSVSHNSYISGNAFEALVGAIYIDRGYKACMTFVEKKILSHLVNIDKVAEQEVNFKSKLLEWAQKNRILLSFELIAEDKDDKGNPVFEHIIRIETLAGATGRGYSKKESQQVAAKKTLNKLHHDSHFLDAVYTAKKMRQKQENDA